jgi:hypothetical protein
MTLWHGLDSSGSKQGKEAGYWENSNKFSTSIKCGDFLDYVRKQAISFWKILLRWVSWLVGWLVGWLVTSILHKNTKMRFLF